MPQISLYIDEKTLKKVEKAAKAENKSISKWVSSKLKSSLENKWPKEYFTLFASIKDESFTEPVELEDEANLKREKL